MPVKVKLTTGLHKLIVSKYKYKSDMISGYSQSKKLTPDIITGYVLDCSSREPIFWANVHILNSDETSLTNDNGEFKIISWKGFPVTVKFAHDHFEPVNLKVTGVREGLIVMLRRKL